MPPTTLDASLARLAVALFAGAARDLETGARHAAKHRLAGLYRYGLGLEGAALPADAEAALHRAAAREALDDVLVDRETGVVLGALEGLEPLVLKGRALGIEVWPSPAHRPAGDLDLLVDAEALPAAAAALAPLGYRAAVVDAGGRWRPGAKGFDLLPPPGARLIVDVLARPFRMVGAGIDGAGLRARARAGTLSGRPVRFLEDADRLLYTYVHAAQHAVAEPKWLLDLYALALRADDRTWEQAARRAAASGATRPFAVAAEVVARLPGVRLGPSVPRAPLLGRLFTVERARRGGPVPQWQRYAMQLVLEESLAARARRLLGFAEGRLRLVPPK